MLSIINGMPMTPWGLADNVEPVADGIAFVSTPSHGGYLLSGAALEQMPAYFKAATFGNVGPRWYEEDCDWAMVALAFPQHFKADAYDHARKIMAAFKPDLLAQFEADPARRQAQPACTVGLFDPHPQGDLF